MSNNKLRDRQKQLLEIHKRRKQLLQPFLLQDELIEGSYAEVHQKCGRSGCHCEKEPTHFVTRLSCWSEGKLKHKVVRIADRVWIKRLSKSYRKHKNALVQLSKITTKERKIMKAIIELKKRRYE